MTAERLQLLLVRGAIAELSPAEQEQIRQRAEDLRKLVADDIGKCALGLVGAELAAGEPEGGG